MSRKRRERQEAELASLEADYREVLVGALQECAKGKWGLFGQNDHLLPSAVLLRTSPGALGELAELAATWRGRAAALGRSEPFRIMQLFEDHRGRADANQLGETRLAALLLSQIAEEQL